MLSKQGGQGIRLNTAQASREVITIANQRAIDTAADALSTTALYSSDKTERLRAIRGLANLAWESPKAADTLATIAHYSSDPELKRAAMDALGGV
jgi:hypothetical protein